MSIAERRVFNLKGACPEFDDFERKYNFDLVKTACGKAIRAKYILSEDSPRLCDVEKAYGKNMAKVWVANMLTLTMGFSTGKIDEDVKMQYTTIIDVCFEQFNPKRISAFMVFCAMCLCGEYKISYGSVKANVILEAMATFLRALPKMEQDAYEELKKNTPVIPGVIWKPDYDTWQYLTLKGRLRCAWLSTKERYEKDGLKGIYESINSGKSDAGEDMYYASIQIVMRRGLARIADKEMIFDEDKYNEQLITLKD